MINHIAFTLGNIFLFVKPFLFVPRHCSSTLASASKAVPSESILWLIIHYGQKQGFVAGDPMSSLSLQTSKRTLAGDVYESLRADLLTCRIAPGSKIRINELCSQLGVNLGAVREALSKLSSEGLVTAEAQKGFRVAPVSRQDLIDLTSTRIDIENLCLADAIANGDVVWESQIVASLHHLSRLPERDPEDLARLSEAWVVAHAAFHQALVGACRNATKMRIRASLYDQSERYRRLSVPASGATKRDTLAEHRAIADATLARDLSAAARLMADHLNKTTEILMAAPFLED